MYIWTCSTSDFIIFRIKIIEIFSSFTPIMVFFLESYWFSKILLVGYSTLFISLQILRWVSFLGCFTSTATTSIIEWRGNPPFWTNFRHAWNASDYYLFLKNNWIEFFNGSNSCVNWFDIKKKSSSIIIIFWVTKDNKK